MAAAKPGNPQFYVWRKVGTYDIVENAPLGIPMELGLDLYSIGFKINATLDVTAAATAVRAEAPSQLIQRVELVADGKNTIASVPFVNLTHGNAFRHSRAAVTPPTGVSIANYAVKAAGKLDMATVDGVNPKDTALHTNQFGSLRLRLTFGSAAACFVGGTVGLGAGSTVDVFVKEAVELTTAGQTAPRFVRKMSYLEQDITANNTNLLIPLPVGNQIRAVELRAEDAGEPVDTIINNVKLYSGTDVRFDLDGEHVKDTNIEDYGAFASGGMPAGFYIADFCADGRLTNAWDLRGIQQAWLSLDVTSQSANSKVYVTPIELVG